ncbi:zinc finger domain-containing protein [Streptomyces sp. NPDC054956]
MPEGDSVYRVAARLREALAGEVLIRSDLRVPRFATADLTGLTTLGVVPRGKHLLIRLGEAGTQAEAGPGTPPEARAGAEPGADAGPGPGADAGPGPGAGAGARAGAAPRGGTRTGGDEAKARPAAGGTPLLTLHTHLRMDGTWRILPTPAGGTPPGPAHEIRVILATAAHTAVGYRLPVVELLRTADEHRVVGHLGPDLLGPDWDAEAAAANLLAAPGRPLGEALLDQRNLAGIGNIYKAELCFLAQVTPWTPVGDIPPATFPRLAAAAHRLLDANKDRRRNTTGSRRPGQDLFVYGRTHRPCLRCATPVREAPQDGRPTYWCPRCQSGPTP